MRNYENQSISFPRDTIDRILKLNERNSAGDTLNNILDAYKTVDAVAAAIHRHALDPDVDRSEKKKRSCYVTPGRMEFFREYAQKTYIPFEGVIRILVQDYLKHK